MSGYSVFIIHGGTYNSTEVRIDNGAPIHIIWLSTDLKILDPVWETHFDLFHGGGHPYIFRVWAVDFPFEAYKIDRTGIDDLDIIWVLAWEER